MRARWEKQLWIYGHLAFRAWKRIWPTSANWFTKITNIYKYIDLEEKATLLHFLKNPSILFPYFLLQQSFLPCTKEYQTPWTCALISSSGGSSTSTTPTQTQVPPRVAKEVWKVGSGGRVSGWRVMSLHEMLEYIYYYIYIFMYITV